MSTAADRIVMSTKKTKKSKMIIEDEEPAEIIPEPAKIKESAEQPADDRSDGGTDPGFQHYNESEQKENERIVHPVDKTAKPFQKKQKQPEPSVSSTKDVTEPKKKLSRREKKAKLAKKMEKANKFKIWNDQVVSGEEIQQKCFDIEPLYTEARKDMARIDAAMEIEFISVDENEIAELEQQAQAAIKTLEKMQKKIAEIKQDKESLMENVIELEERNKMQHDVDLNLPLKKQRHTEIVQFFKKFNAQHMDLSDDEE